MTVATLSVTLTSSGWTLLAAGPLEVAVTSGTALFQISDTAPTDPTLSGFPLTASGPLNATGPHLFDVASNIYARALSGTAMVEYAAIPASGGSTPNQYPGADYAKDGTDITGASMPSGGVGIRGWLSAIAVSLKGVLAVAIGQSSTAGDASIATGGTAQTLFGGATPTNGFTIANPDASEDLWISDSTTAALNGQGSIKVAAGYVYETPPAYKPAGPVSVYGATTGHHLTARRW